MRTNKFKASLLGLCCAVFFWLPLAAFANNREVNLVSREIGSGTRTAFVELMGIVDSLGDDILHRSAVIQNSTNGVMQTVSLDPNAIGYISLGSLNDTVKSVSINGIEPTAENIKAHQYALARPFIVAWNKREPLSDLTQDFLMFVHSSQGQALVEKKGYVSVEGKFAENNTGQVDQATGLPIYQSQNRQGTIEIVGSTSVTPVIEVLGEAYRALNPRVTVNITSNGSSAGMQAAMDGTADLGMASRDLSDKEVQQLEQDAIALDGIIVIVNKKNPVTNLSLDEIRNIFLGNLTRWDDVEP